MRSIVLSLLALLAAGCDGRTTVSGRVLDPNNEPISQAVVKFVQQPDDPEHGRVDEKITDHDGVFYVAITHAPKSMPFLLEVSKEGFVKHEEKLIGSAVLYREIVLKPVDE
jgi:hypothetical protein